VIELESSHVAEVVCVCKDIHVKLEGTTLQCVMLWVYVEMFTYAVEQELHDHGGLLTDLDWKWVFCAIVLDHQHDFGTSTQTEKKTESRFLLDIVFGKCATVHQLSALEDEALLIWRD
jgi:hypothetical protein